MIREKYNLKCKVGHYHYAPNPKYWVGMNCGKPFGNPLRKDGMAMLTGEKCDRPLALLRKR